MVKKPIRKKILFMMLSVSLLSLILISLLHFFFLRDMNHETQNTFSYLDESAEKSSTTALREQMRTRLLTLSQDRASIADANLQMILNQTRTVAMAARDIYENRDRYLEGQKSSLLPVDTYNLSLSSGEEIGRAHV